ncbi:MAG TPA: dihydrodipicolinate synthase family protein, partial [Firmicutes bacterium]|nr:dihydrodipicolinate synthase family protein [Bacillota bacterium]
PFTSEGTVDEKSVRSLCRYLIESKINGLYPLGTNGEGVFLSTVERKKVAEIFVSEVQHKIPVVIQCGAITTAESVELARHAASIKADGIGIMTPFFFNQDEEALIAYYTTVAKAAPELPMYVYNIPSHTNNDILPSTVAKLAKLVPNLIGVKYSVPNLIRLSEYMKAVPSAGVLIGCDRLILPALSLGAVGIVSGPAMAFPHLFTGLLEAFRKGDLEGVRKFQARLLDLDGALAPFPAIPLLKEILKRKGVIACSLPKAPMRSLNDHESRQLDSIIEQFKD